MPLAEPMEVLRADWTHLLDFIARELIERTLATHPDIDVEDARRVVDLSSEVMNSTPGDLRDVIAVRIAYHLGLSSINPQ